MGNVSLRADLLELMLLSRIQNDTLTGNEAGASDSEVSELSTKHPRE